MSQTQTKVKSTKVHSAAILNKEETKQQLQKSNECLRQWNANMKCNRIYCNTCVFKIPAHVVYIMIMVRWRDIEQNVKTGT